MPEALKKIIITRPLSEKQISMGTSLGLNPVSEPALSISYRDDWSKLLDFIGQTAHPKIAFTSQHAVKAFKLFLEKTSVRTEDIKTYAVGEKTASPLKNLGFSPKVPEQHNAVQLAKLIVRQMKESGQDDSTILHLCGNRRRDEFRQFLNDQSLRVKDIVVYETHLRNMAPDLTDVEAILFYSPSAVQAFRKSVGFQQTKNIQLFAIGTTTAEELSIESGQSVLISPETNTHSFLHFVAQTLHLE